MRCHIDKYICDFVPISEAVMKMYKCKNFTATVAIDSTVMILTIRIVFQYLLLKSQE